MYEPQNLKLLHLFERFLNEAPSHLEIYNKRENLASQTLIDDIRQLHNRQFKGVHEMLPIMLRVMQTVY